MSSKCVSIIQGGLEYRGLFVGTNECPDFTKRLLTIEPKAPPVGTVRLIDERLYYFSHMWPDYSLWIFGLKTENTLVWKAVTP